MGIEELDAAIKRARSYGALYHPTNPHNAWFCDKCCVFGKDDLKCWVCGSTDINRQWVPRFGGGAQTVAQEMGIIVDERSQI